jgi:peptide/nickel transport system ATP-binding protein
MTDNVLEVRHLEVEFATDEQLVKAVKNISFELKRGQTLGIVGESGSGKSVTSLAIMGLIPTPGKVRGEIWFRDSAADGSKAVDLAQLPSEQLRHYRGGKIAMIFQEPMSSLNPVYTCGFQLTEAIRLHQDVSPAEARRLAVASLQEVKLVPSDEEFRQRYLEDEPRSTEREINQYINQQKLAILERYPHELSGGQLQRVMIAMAISCNPAILIADEPTTALDVTVQATILELMRELRDRRGMSMVFITHDLGVIAEIADWVGVMYQGKIVEFGSVLQIFSNPQNAYTKGLLACRPQPNRQVSLLPTVADFMEVVTTPNGEIEIREKPPVPATEAVKTPEKSTSPNPQSPLLEVRNLQVGFPIRGVFGETKRYTWAVNNISFEVYPGETLGLVGESGCGKSTLARTLLRLIEPMGGQIFFEGRNITSLTGKPLRELRREMQIVFQNPFSSLDPRMKIGQAVMEPLLIHGVSKNAKLRQERAVYLLERVGLNAEAMNRYPHEFSGGQRQRACIARALALNPKFIICDESVSALDVSVQAQVLNLFKELQSEFRLTYIFISHDLSVVKFMSDRIMVMNRGKIEEINSAESIYDSPTQDYTRQLIASIPVSTIARIQERQQAREKTTAIDKES